jgi:hypothetical protein
MANKANRFLFAITMLAAIFAYSCLETCPPSYYAKIAKANWISYTSLYPDVTMEPDGYYLNEMAEYGDYQYANDICNYYIDNLNEEERDLYISQAGGNRYRAINYCIKSNKQDHIHTIDTNEIKNWLKSANTPFYEAINREVLDKFGSFLGFYYVEEQEYYIYVEGVPGG